MHPLHCRVTMIALAFSANFGLAPVHAVLLGLQPEAPAGAPSAAAYSGTADNTDLREVVTLLKRGERKEAKKAPCPFPGEASAGSPWNGSRGADFYGRKGLENGNSVLSAGSWRKSGPSIGPFQAWSLSTDGRAKTRRRSRAEPSDSA